MRIYQFSAIRLYVLFIGLAFAASCARSRSHLSDFDWKKPPPGKNKDTKVVAQKSEETANLNGIEVELAGDFDSILDDVIKPYCLNCHNGSAESGNAVVLSDYDSMMPSRERRPIVMPFDSTRSRLIDSLVERSAIHNRPGRILSESLIQVIRAWIDNGAPRVGLGGATALWPDEPDDQEYFIGEPR